MHFELDTGLLCLLGWLTHWMASWWEAWKVKKLSLLDFLNENPPAFWFSITATLAVYLIGPAALNSFGVQLPAAMDSDGVALLIAFMLGYMADSIVYKIANVAKNRDNG